MEKFIELSMCRLVVIETRKKLVLSMRAELEAEFIWRHVNKDKDLFATFLIHSCACAMNEL